mmetsp:Transcript_28633/g.77234  ORF Transcript_28633/g.77234 Transcript_28633/m.77234 type:complete len:246 (-) Transcript_28633:58-795(-)
MASSTSAALPEPLRPMTSMLQPRPTGVNTSSAFTPVSSGSVTCSRFIIVTCWFSRGTGLPMLGLHAPWLTSAAPGILDMPRKSSTLPNTSAPAGDSNSSNSFLVTGPCTSSTTCSTPLMMQLAWVPRVMSAAPPRMRAKARFSERCHRRTPVPPVTKAILVPNGASELRPLRMATLSCMYTTLPTFTEPSSSRSVSSWFGAEIRLLKMLISLSQSGLVSSSSSLPLARASTRGLCLNGRSLTAPR